MSIATYNEKLSPSGYAGVFWVALLFSALIALPRTFTIEEEQGTSDLLRLTARPHAVFWGKAIYNLIQVWIAALALSVLFCAFAHLSISIPWLFAVAMIGSGGALAGAFGYPALCVWQRKPVGLALGAAQRARAIQFALAGPVAA